MTGKRSRIITLTAVGAFSVAGAVTASVAVPSSASPAPAGATSIAFAHLDAATQRQSDAMAALQQAGASPATRFTLDTQQAAFQQAAKENAAKAAAKAAARRAEARKKAAAKAAAKKAAAARNAAHARLVQQRAAAVPSGSPQQVARAMVGQFGWSASEYGCLVPLWGHESGWSVSASNPSSGAYGIPQALPGSKMSSAGPDWESSAATQIKWGLQYIQSTYGSPCGAWSHEESAGWY